MIDSKISVSQNHFREANLQKRCAKGGVQHSQARLCNGLSRNKPKGLIQKKAIKEPNVIPYLNTSNTVNIIITKYTIHIPSSVR
jgi:hypothetical protein